MAAHTSIHGDGGGNLSTRLLRAGAWTLPFLTPVAAYLLIALFTPIFNCGCLILKMLVVFAGAYLGILFANLIVRRTE
jgi:hypothetical protein